MGRALVVINTEDDRQRAADWISKAPIRTRIEFRGPQRTLPQNDRLWAMLTDIVRQQKTINGQKFETNQWRAIFLQALGEEPELLPTLNGKGFFATETSSSRLSVEEFSNLIELIFAWGAENDVVWSDPNQWQPVR